MSMPPYVLPAPQGTYPKGLSFRQFLQTIFVGVSGLPGTLVRPQWQPEPPQQPDINVNWMAMGIAEVAPNASAYVGLNQDGQVTTDRHEDVEVKLSIYGPDNLEIYGVLQDGFQLTQNRILLTQANMGFTEMSRALHIPDLVNQRWVDRIECSAFFRREVQRTYPVLSFVSSSGTIYVSDTTPQYSLDWLVEE